MARDGWEFSFQGREVSRGDVLFLNQKEMLSAAEGHCFKLNEKAEEFERRFLDTPKGDLVKKGWYFYEEVIKKRRLFIFVKNGEKIVFTELPEELSKDLFPFLLIRGKKRKGRVAITGGAAAPVEYLHDLRARNPHLKREIVLKNCFEVMASGSGSVVPAPPDGVEIGEKLGFAAAFQKLEIPFIHDPAKCGYSILESDDCGTALRKLVRKELHRIKGFCHFTKAGIHPEYLHEMRVAIRRLRSYLRIFPSVFGEKRSASLGLTASTFGVDLGRLRDLDVFREKLIGWLIETGRTEKELERFSKPFTMQAEEEFEIISRVLGSRKYRDFVARIENLSKEKTGSNVFSREPFVAASLKAMRLYRNETRKRARKYFSTSDPLALHRVRIAFKRFRYLFESLEHLFAGETGAFKAYRKDLVGIQDALGNYQDIRVAGRLIDEALERTGDKETLVAFGALKQLLKTKQKDEEKKFLKIFKEFRKMKEPKIIKGG